MLFLRNVLAAALVPGTVVGLIPYAIARGRDGVHTASGVVEFVAVAVLGLGVAIMGWCIRDFAVVGRGTLAPIDPPTALVRKGLYQYVRNPMYLGALLVLIGETTLFASTALLTYTAVWFIWVNLFVMFYEEPTLAKQFGASYEEYRRSVGRWIPRRRSVRG